MERDLERERQFSRNLSRIAAACRQELDDLTLEVYTEALCYQTEPQEWDRFTREAVASGRFSWFPKVVEILDALAEFRGAPPLDVEAETAYQRALGAGTYTAEEGTSWTYRGVLSACGRAAADAFLAAGGDEAFRTAWQQDKRRAKFLEAYVSVARVEPSARCLGAAPEQKTLPAPVEAEPISHVDAARILDKVRLVSIGAPEPRKPVVVEATPERIAFLKRQAAELLEQEAATVPVPAEESKP